MKIPSHVPATVSHDHVNPEQVVQALTDLEPFDKQESKMIAEHLANKHYLYPDSYQFVALSNINNSSSEVELDVETTQKLIKVLEKCVRADKNVFVSYYHTSDDDGEYSEQSKLICSTKGDKNKLNKQIINKLRHLITENRKYAAQREKEKKAEQDKIAKMKKLFDALQNKTMTFEEFQKESSGLLECVSFTKR